MWSALGMYALRETWREKKKLRKMKRKHKAQRIIISNDIFYSDESSFLPSFEEVKVQEQLQEFYDPTSPDEYSKYVEFEYSMGGNIKMYENHIAITSPKKKLQKAIEKKETGIDQTKTNRISDTIGKMDAKDAHAFDEGRGKHMKHGDDLDFGTSNLNSSFENLAISDHGRKSRKPNRSSSSHDDVEIRRTIPSKDRDYSPIRTTARSLERQEDLSATTSRRAPDRDYSPIHSTVQVKLETDEYYKAKSTLAANKDYHEPKTNTHNSVRLHEHSSRTHNPSIPNKPEDINVLESLSRYDLTLNYVHQQNKTLQNGDYNDLDIGLSDLSSDVFTDSELQFNMPENDTSDWTRDRPDKDFYPDSPVSEGVFFKTPCSSRKNSYDSLMSEESLTDLETDVRGNIQAPIRRSLMPTNGHNGHTNGITNGHVKSVPKPTTPPMQNGKAKIQSVTKIHDVRNGKAKPALTNNKNSKQGNGRVKIINKKVDYSKTAKSKIDSFRNINHVPGGGNKKIANGKVNQYKHVEPRTDTHGVEAYSHLPAEFQEIARRLSRQDKELRDVNGGRGRPRSRITSRSSRGSMSPRDRSPGKTGNLAKHYGTNLSASLLSLTSTASAKKRRSIHPRPVTPSLSRSHPATSCTLYDSRSRPSSRQASRSSSPVRSRNPSPSRIRSRTSSPSRGRSHNGAMANGRSSRSTSPHRERRPRKSSTSGSGYDTPRSDRSKSRNRSGSRSRLDDSRSSTPVMDILSYNNTSRSLFQVVPVHR